MVVSDVVVVDTSVAFKWIVTEHDSELADALLLSWYESGTRLIGPAMLPAELTNAVHRRIQREELTQEQGAAAVERFMQMELEIRETASLSPRALELANQLRQGAVYDSYYLALAETLDCEFWTADEKLHQAARGVIGKVQLLSDFDPTDSA